MSLPGKSEVQRTEILTLGLGGEAFAIEAIIVSEILDLVTVTPVPNAPDYAPGLINVRGKVVPLVDLRVRLGMQRQESTIDTRIVVIEINLDGEPTIIGVLADRVYEVAEIDLAKMKQTPHVGMRWRSEYIRGIGRRGNDFLIILDIERIVSGDLANGDSDGAKGNDRPRLLQTVH